MYVWDTDGIREATHREEARKLLARAARERNRKRRKALQERAVRLLHEAEDER